MASIAELLATGEAWASDLEDFHSRHTPAPVNAPAPVVVVEPVADPAVAQAPVLTAPVVERPAAAPVVPTPAAAAPVPVFPPAVPLVPAPPGPRVAPTPLPVSAPPVPIVESPSARSALEAALVELLPQQDGEPPAAPPVQPPPRRVQLGFRDGSSATLDPDSSQYQALEELAQSLTRRD